jgi:CubicO group peptidase (beta-lactamase class C family)
MRAVWSKIAMRKALILTIALLALIPAAVLAQTSDSSPKRPLSDTELTEAINARFESFRKGAHAPGLVWGIVQNGHLTHVGTLGVQDIEIRRPVTADTVFRIASMSKAFTALAVLELEDAGKLSLDDSLDRYVPESAHWQYPTEDSPKLSIRDLLGHTGGLGPDDPWSDRQQPISEEDFTALLKNGISFNQAPETAYEYSSLGYALLGRVVTKASGVRYDRYIEKALLRPLGMSASGYEMADVPTEKRAVGYRWENDAFVREPTMANGAFGAMGGLHSSANDYARWVAFLLSAWPARDARDPGPVRRAIVRELAIGTSVPRLGSRPRPGNTGPCSFASVYSAGFNVVRDCELGLLLTHNGGYPGYGSTILLMPDDGVGIFAFDNRTYGVPVAPVFEAAEMLKDAGLLKASTVPTNDGIGRAYSLVRAMYQAGNVEPGLDDLAVNFLLDRSADNWAREFAGLKDAVGTCSKREPVSSTGLRTGTFIWQCEKGSIRGTIELAPTRPPVIQTLKLHAQASKNVQ